MDGFGYYLYDDGGSYDGEFKNNWQEGEGISRYVYKLAKVTKHFDDASIDMKQSSEVAVSATAENQEALTADGTSQSVVPDAASVVVLPTPAIINHDQSILAESKSPRSNLGISSTSGTNSSATHLSEGKEFRDTIDEVVTSEGTASQVNDHFIRINDKFADEEVVVETHKYDGQWRRGKFHGQAF
jgi:hypothetical protein